MIFSSFMYSMWSIRHFVYYECIGIILYVYYKNLLICCWWLTGACVAETGFRSSNTRGQEDILYHPLLTHRACAELVFYLPDKLHGLGPRCLKTLSGYFSLNYCTMNYTALLLYTWFCNLIKKILNMKTYVLYLYFTQRPC